MPSVWKTARVFISSTFRDMHAERDHLIKVVFPALRERLEKYRIYLDDIDLRWGVTREQAENDQVLDLCLQQIDECRPFFIGILGERYGWVPTQFPVQTLSQQGWVQYHTGKSVTDLEIVYGVLTKPGMRRHAFFYFRDPAALDDIPEEIRSCTFAETDPERIANLTDLKERIRRNGYSPMDPYPARWDAQAYDRPTRTHGRLVGLEAFGERVREQLWEAIKAEHNLPDAPPPETALDPLAVELDYHERFMESRLRVHVLRQQINDKLLAFAENDATVPCLVTGPSGSGKSASLARFVMDYQRAHPDALVVPHFIGASPRSTNLRPMLRRFCQVLKARLGLAEEVPEEVTKLAVAFREFIGKVPPNLRVLFVIDALNQLDETDRAQNLAWLPVQFPPQVKVVVSCISDSGKAEPALDAFAGRQHVSLAVGPLDDEERRKIIQAVPSLSAKALDDQQIEQLLANPATTNPLFLLVALEELRGFGSYERLNERITAFPREGDTVTAIFTQVIERLEEEFAREAVRPILLLLAVARRGLSERELQELVGGLPGADDLFPVLRQLRPYLLRRAELIDFYHRNLYKAVRDRYMDTPETHRAGHAWLAGYFDSQPLWLQTDDQAAGSPSAPTLQPNVRKVDELPWQWLQAKHGEQLNNLLTDLAFLEAKTAAGLVFDLVTDFRQTGSLLATDLRASDGLGPWYYFVLSNPQFLQQHPHCFFQQAFNEPVDSPVSRAAQRAWAAETPGGVLVPHVLEAILEWTNRHRDWQPPACLMTLTGHTWYVRSVALSIDGMTIISGSADKTLKVWDARTGECLSTLTGHKGEVTSVACFADGMTVVSGSEDEAVKVWDAQSGTCRLTLTGHLGYVLSVACSADGRILVSGSKDNTVKVWLRQTGECLHTLTGHRNSVNSVALSGDARIVVSGSDDGEVKVWDSQTGNCLRTLSGHEDRVYCVACSADGRRIISGSQDKTAKVWDTHSGACLRTFNGHNENVTCVACSADGRTIISGSTELKFWDIQSGGCLKTFVGCGGSVAFSADRRMFVSAASGNTLRVWDTQVEACRPPLAGHEDCVTGLDCSADRRIVVSGSYDGTVRIWDARTDNCLRTLPRHNRPGWDHTIRSVACSADGRTVVSLSGRMVKFWDVETGECRLTNTITDCSPDAVAFSADERLLYSWPYDECLDNRDNLLKVWDAETGACLATHPKKSSEAQTLLTEVLDHSTQRRRKRSGLSAEIVSGNLVVETSVSVPGRTATSVSPAQQLIAPGPFWEALGPLVDDRIIAFTASGEAHWFRIRRRNEATPSGS